MYSIVANNFIYFTYSKAGMSSTNQRNMIYKAYLTSITIDWQLYNCLELTSGIMTGYVWASTTGTVVMVTAVSQFIVPGNLQTMTDAL